MSSIKNIKIISSKPYLLKALRSCDKLSEYTFTKDEGLEIQDLNDSVEVNGTSFQKPLKLERLANYIVSLFEKNEFVIGDVKFNPMQRRISNAGEELSLTEKEAAILLYLIEHKDVEIDKADILSKVWGYDKTANTTTLESHIYRLRLKLATIELGELIASTEKSYKLSIY